MSQTLDNLSYTWNNAGTTFTGIKYNVTDTASAAGSLLMDLQVGGSSKFKLDKNGSITVPLNQYLYFGSVAIRGTASEIQLTGANLLVAPDQAVILYENGGGKAYLYCDKAADTLAQRRSTNAQEFRLYNTYTDASNYERAKFKWDTNVLKIGTEKAGTGSARALEFQTDGVTRLTISTVSGNSTFTGDVAIGQNAYFYWNGRSQLKSPANGKIVFLDATETGAMLLQVGGTTSSFPALKRSTTTLQVRLADDSDYTNIQGKLTTHANAVAETPTATHTLTIYDAAGTAYKVLAVAA